MPQVNIHVDSNKVLGESAEANEVALAQARVFCYEVRNAIVDVWGFNYSEVALWPAIKGNFIENEPDVIVTVVASRKQRLVDTEKTLFNQIKARIRSINQYLPDNFTLGVWIQLPEGYYHVG